MLAVSEFWCNLVTFSDLPQGNDASKIGNQIGTPRQFVDT